LIREANERGNALVVMDATAWALEKESAELRRRNRDLEVLLSDGIKIERDLRQQLALADRTICTILKEKQA
jgi:hypothetical protein